MKRNYEFLSLTILLVVLAIIYVKDAINFPGSFQGGDGMRHYLVSRYSWAHPEQLLYLWGKPFFTLVSSPFSQAGLIGMKIFNIICALLSAIIIYRIAKLLNLRLPVLASLFMGFTPFYMFGTNSGYTEVLFGLITVFAIHEYMLGRLFLSTMLISLLPFVRSEGYLIIPLFFIVLLLQKKYYHILLLAFGNVAYSIIGYFHFNDLFWLYHQNPYDGHMAEIYGSGPLLHFVRSYDIVWGKPLFLLLLIGLISALIRTVKRTFFSEKYFREEFFLIYGSFLVYFIAHSIFWWQGLFNSLGLERVLIAVMPVCALISLRGLNLILSVIRRKRIQNVITAFFVIAIILNPFKNPNYPLRLDAEEELVLEVKKWYEETGLNTRNHKIFYLHPFMPEALSFDAFDQEKVSELWGFYYAIEKWGYGSIPDSTLVFWDAHYGPNESLLPLESLLKDKHFRLIKSFRPKKPFHVLGNYPFEIHVFQKVKPESNTTEKYMSRKYDFETGEGLADEKSLTVLKAHSGMRSAAFRPSEEYGATIIEKVESIISPEKVQCIKFRALISSEAGFETEVVLSMHKGDEQLSWNNYSIKFSPDTSQWKEVSGQWLIDTSVLMKSDKLKLYVWNKNRNEFYVDDFEIEYANRCD